MKPETYIFIKLTTHPNVHGLEPVFCYFNVLVSRMKSQILSLLL